jgi:hypothetical protein
VQPEAAGVWADAVKVAETVARTRRREDILMGILS